MGADRRIFSNSGKRGGGGRGGPKGYIIGRDLGMYTAGVFCEPVVGDNREETGTPPLGRTRLRSARSGATRPDPCDPLVLSGEVI